MYVLAWYISAVDGCLLVCFIFTQQYHLHSQTGDIVMFTGMMEVLDNDDQVAAVLAHEMSHTILEHVVSVDSLYLQLTMGKNLSLYHGPPYLDTFLCCQSIYCSNLISERQRCIFSCSITS